MIRLGTLPAVALLYYIYKLDRIEREPLGLEYTILTVFFLVYIVVLDIIAFLCVKKYAAEDRPIHTPE